MTWLGPLSSGQSGLLDLVESSSHQNFFACYQCGKCTAACPFSFSPQLVMRHLQMGQMEEALTQSTTWSCASCLTCQTVCPKGVSPAKAIKTMRKIATGEIPCDEKASQDLKKLDLRPSDHHLRSAFFGNINPISRWGSRAVPLSNWMMKMPGAKTIAHHVIGVHKSRALPRFERPSFPDWFKLHVPKSDGPLGEVVLFHDTFMDFELTHIGVAVTDILERAGFRVSLSNTVCCGRPMISKGLHKKAKKHAEINVERLHDRAAAGLFIVGCEPSCLLTLRTEYPEMLRDGPLAEKANVVAKQSLLFDEFLIRQWRQGELEIRPNGGSQEAKPLLFHGHCQQKAEADVGTTIKLLQLSGFEVEMIPASCCGMAGAFGFEKEHFAASKEAGERALLPTIRAHPESDIAVMGISCRKQIEDLAQRDVRHVVEFVQQRAHLECTRASSAVDAPAN